MGNFFRKEVSIKCSRCDEETLKKIEFKKSKKIAYLCDNCGALWFKDERSTSTNLYVIQTFTKDGDEEYTFVDAEETKENEAPEYVKYV